MRRIGKLVAAKILGEAFAIVGAGLMPWIEPGIGAGIAAE